MEKACHCDRGEDDAEEPREVVPGHKALFDHRPAPSGQHDQQDRLSTACPAPKGGSKNTRRDQQDRSRPEHDGLPAQGVAHGGAITEEQRHGRPREAGEVGKALTGSGPSDCEDRDQRSNGLSRRPQALGPRPFRADESED